MKRFFVFLSSLIVVQGCTLLFLPHCGDTIIQTDRGEECDDANDDEVDGCNNDCKFVCGDGFVAGVEECDDGNLEPNDGCDGTCLIECGNGAIEGAEECDDSNQENNDGCSAVCKIEGCGDKIFQEGELCLPGIGISGIPNPIGLDTADFNQDSFFDLIVTSPSPDAVISNGTVNILLNDGLGHFSPGFTFTGVGQPDFVLATDLNGDDKPDFAVTQRAGALVDVLVFLNTSANKTGLLTFSAPFVVDLTKNASSIAAGDLNGNGTPDLAISVDGEIDVLFDPGTTDTLIDLALPASPGTIRVSIVDINNDLKQDLISVGFAFIAGDGFVQLNLGDGIGGFPGQPLRPINSLQFATDLAALDVNSDGSLDLVLTNFDNNASELDVFLATSFGNFLSSPSKRVQTSDAPFRISQGDVDGDGDPELATSNFSNNSASILKKQNGTLVEQQTIPSGPAPIFTLLQDLNQDTRADLVVSNANVNFNFASVANGTLGVYLGTGDPIDPFLSAERKDGISLPTQVLSANFDLLDQDDLLVLSQTGVTSGDMFVVSNANGVFGVPASIFNSTTEKPLGADVGDFNADGRPDAVLVTTSKVRVFQNDPGNFFDSATLNVGNARDAIFTELNNDQSSLELAIATTTEIELFVKEGNNFNPVGATIPLRAVDLLAVDLDGDGTTEIVSADENANTVSIARRNVPAAFSFAVSDSIDVGFNVRQVIAANLNNRGELDLIALDEGGAQLAVIPDPAAPLVIVLPLSTRITSIAAQDLNKDGFDDLIATDTATNTVQVFINKHDGTREFFGPFSFVTGNQPSSVAAADFTGDGLIDLLVANQDPPTNNNFVNDCLYLLPFLP
jgi:cysteine-rich repeat protein